MNPTPTAQIAAQLTIDDIPPFAHPYLKTILCRLHSELFSAAKALRGELSDAFWKSIDELHTFRDAPTAPLSDAVPQQLVVLEDVGQRALLMRLRIDMFSVARSLRGDLRDAFWRSIDALNALRPTKA